MVILFSTVTTAFFFFFSATVSFTNLNNKFGEKSVSIIICFIGLLIAILVPTNKFEVFLYLIGSVFAPLFIIVLTDYFVLSNNFINENKLFDLKNSFIWLFVFLLYRFFMNINTPIGTTFPVMLIIGIVCIVFRRFKNV